MTINSPLCIAHLSDLHFAKIDKDLKQFFSKRWIGNLNFLLRRKKDFNHRILESLPELLIQRKTDLVILSGDLSCTSSGAEFLLALDFVKTLQKAGLEVVVIPGNHDHYTKESYKKKTFYDFFPSYYDSCLWNLKDDRVTVKTLKDNWTLVLLDTTLATPLLCCHGKFTEQLERNLEEVLSSIPKTDHVIIANHFPITCKASRPALQRRETFLTLLKKHPNIRCYLHGHNHEHKVLDLRCEGLPIAVDAGSASHSKRGSWSFLECKKDSCSFTPFHWKNGWAPEEPKQFLWE
jgi:3',5'-cyclic AMP phosphodiesterase CpdA